MHATHVVDTVHVDLPWRTSATVGVDATSPQWPPHSARRLRGSLHCSPGMPLLSGYDALVNSVQLNAVDCLGSRQHSASLDASSLQEATFQI